MRVLLLSRADAAAKPGGDLTIMRAYARYLPSLGFEVTMSQRFDAPVEDFDLVHLFALDCCLEPFVHTRRALRAGRRPALVLTPFEHRLAWTLEYHERVMRTDLGHPKSAASPRFNAYFTARDIVRYAVTARHRAGVGRYLHLLARTCYHRRRAAARAVDALCVHTPEEARAVAALLDLPPTRTIIAPVGRSDPEFAPVSFDRPPEYILCVGRIEPLKNQLSILEAVRPLGLPVLFVGRMNQRHRGYCRRFLAEVNRSAGLAQHVSHLDPTSLNTLYRDARVHVLASWAEVFPLTTVEAIAAGCPIITTVNSYEQDVYGDLGRYCTPGSVASISHAIDAALSQPRATVVEGLRALIPPWTQVAGSVAECYRSLVADRDFSLGAKGDED